MRQVKHVLVAFGANLQLGGQNPPETLRASAQALGGHGMVIRRMSRIYASPAFPPGSGPDYANAAALVEVREGPEEVLARLHAVEAAFGRERLGRWGQRVLDLDLLALEDEVRPDAATQDRWRDLPLARQMGEAPGQLILPHPRLQDRAFVLVPLMDVAPDWVHPRLGSSVREMLARLDPADVAAVTPL